MKSALLLDVIIQEHMAILELLSGEDQMLLVRWNVFLVLNLRLYVAYGV